MTGKPEQAHTDESKKRQQGNLGQKEAEQERRSQSELDRMGELTKKGEKEKA